MEHLAPEAVADFWDAVGRHSVSPVTLEQLIKINDVLPSLLYVVTKESMFPHPLKPKVLAIVEFLARQHWFCPKKLKTISYRLLDLESDADRLSQLFLSMDPTHKVYFLLSVFGCWQSRGEYKQLLESLVRYASGDDNAYVWGFAVSIAAKLEVALDSAVESREQVLRIAGDVKKAGAHILRGGVFKPRSSVHSWQGLGSQGKDEAEEALDMLKEAGRKFEMPTVSDDWVTSSPRLSL